MPWDAAQSTAEARDGPFSAPNGWKCNCRVYDSWPSKIVMLTGGLLADRSCSDGQCETPLCSPIPGLCERITSSINLHNKRDQIY